MFLMNTGGTQLQIEVGGGARIMAAAVVRSFDDEVAAGLLARYPGLAEISEADALALATTPPEGAVSMRAGGTATDLGAMVSVDTADVVSVGRRLPPEDVDGPPDSE